MKPLELVGTELRGDTGRKVWCDAGLDFAGATLDLGNLLLGEEFFRGFLRKLHGVEPLGFCREFARVEAELRQALVILRREIITQLSPTFSGQPHITASGI